MASPGNQHCASCIGTLSFPMECPRQMIGGKCRTISPDVSKCGLPINSTEIRVHGDAEEFTCFVHCFGEFIMPNQL